MKDLKKLSVRLKRKKPSSVRTALNLAKASGNLARHVLNPVKVAKSVKKAIKGEGYVLPGAKYIGPGNRMDLGKPKTSGDAIAYQHDKDYDALLKKGARAKDVYLGYSHADKRALKKSWKRAKKGSGQALAVAAGMGIKALGHKIGLTKRHSKKTRRVERQLGTASS